MVLSGQEIKRQLGTNIVIDPFDESRLNPNSYDLALHDELMVYEEVVLDMRKANRVRRIGIPREGLVLQPNQLYLGRTVERTETHNFVPMIEGRSSIGRLGLFVHVTAGFGDVGFCGFWTLEMFAVQPVRIYAGVAICQIFYHDIHGDITEYRSGKYQHNTDIQPSLLVQGTQPRVRQRPATEAPLRHGAIARVGRRGGIRTADSCPGQLATRLLRHDVRVDRGRLIALVVSHSARSRSSVLSTHRVAGRFLTVMSANNSLFRRSLVMKTVSTMLALIVSLLIVGNVQPPKRRRPTRARSPADGGISMAEMLKDLNLTDEQKAKIEKLEQGVRR